MEQFGEGREPKIGNVEFYPEYRSELKGGTRGTPPLAYLLPVLFGVVGGVIAWAIWNKRKNSVYLFVVGSVVSLISIISHL